MVFLFFSFFFHFLSSVCKNGVYLWQGRCLASCPIGSYAEHPNLFNGIISEACIPCHYSCLSCAGSSDSQCSSCHADAQLRSVTTAGMILPPVAFYYVAFHWFSSIFLWSGAKGTEEQWYCQPAALVVQLESFEHWALGIELLLGVNLAVVFALAAYMICYGSAKSVCWCWRPREKSSNYHSLMSVNGREDKNAGLNQSDYVDQMAGFADESSASLLSDEKMWNRASLFIDKYFPVLLYTYGCIYTNKKRCVVSVALFFFSLFWMLSIKEIVCTLGWLSS